MDQKVRVKFSGGREVIGVLKGFDNLINLVLDDVQEFLRDPSDPTMVTDDTRSLGLLAVRGPSVMMIGPANGMEEIANPFFVDPAQPSMVTEAGAAAEAAEAPAATAE